MTIHRTVAFLNISLRNEGTTIHLQVTEMVRKTPVIVCRVKPPPRSAVVSADKSGGEKQLDSRILELGDKSG